MRARGVKRAVRSAAALVLAVSLIAAGFGAAPGGAQTTRDVAVRNSFFDPSTLGADPGDPIVWTWAPGSFTHTVTANDGSFSSGPQTSGTFSITYTGGVVAYRCEVHGFIDASGACVGMCGIVRGVDLTPPPPPVITQPAEGASLDRSDVTVAGTTSADTAAVRLREAGVVRAEVAAAGGVWSTVAGFTTGTHTVDATAHDSAGNESGPSTPVTFSVVDTTPPPPPVITQPADGTWLKATTVTVAGTASTDTLTVRLSEDGVLLRQVPAGGTWSTALVFAAGPHALEATALDGAGNESLPSARVSFTIDVTPPEGTITSPSNHAVVLSPVTFAGGARDNFSVARVRLTVWDRLRNTRRELLLATCSGCPAADVNWTLTVILPAGLHQAWVTVEDRALNVSMSAPVTFLVL